MLVLPLLHCWDTISTNTPLSLDIAITNASVDCEARFEDYKATYSKSYLTLEENSMRFYYFKKAVRTIDYINGKASGADDLVLALNEFSDWSNYEFRDLLGRTEYYLDYSDPSEPSFDGGSGSSRRRLEEHENGTNQASRHHSASNNSAKHRKGRGLAATVDWVADDKVAAVRNQIAEDGTVCGSGYAAAAVAAVEAANAITNSLTFSNDAPALSVEDVVACSSAEGNNGCGGGTHYWAFDYLIANGISLDSDVPYTATDDNCAPAGTLSDVSVSSYANVTRGSTSALTTAVDAAPVVVAINGDGNYFRHYSGGIIRHCGDDDINHLVLVVGYGTSDDGNDYWIIQNSWGSGWGDSGYAYISKGTHEPEEIDYDGDGVTDFIRVKRGPCGILSHGA